MAPFVRGKLNRNRQGVLKPRLLLISVAFVVLVSYSKFVGFANEEADEITDQHFLNTRSLLSSEDDDGLDYGDKLVCAGVDIPLFPECKVLDSEVAAVGVIGCVFGLLYLFVGIAIVCDEIFVPALEIIAERNHLSNDVAGATLMAAGGSAPELATSLIGTFKRSDVGFGTIVGSAVFNVLFVIGVCAMLTPEAMKPLKLTWWPLFRDCTYYIITLFTLAVFMYTGNGKVELWEALVQFMLYVGYVVLMAYSEVIERWVKSTSTGKV